MTQQVQSNKEANLSKQVAELQGRVKSLEQLLHQGEGCADLGRGSQVHGHCPQFTLQDDPRADYPVLQAEWQDDLLREVRPLGMGAKEPCVL